MITIQSSKEITAFVHKMRNAGKTIGFVPTMGALHNGHLSLIQQCKDENDICIVSIFVNPTQFNDKNDLANYPRTIDMDKEMLESVSCDVLFFPPTEEMYNSDETKQAFSFDFAGLDKVMEGKSRPNHFNGVVQIVSKLFTYIAADKAYFGEKDFQQLAIIIHMSKVLNFAVEIVACPTIREEGGLAMSSRNELLTKEERKIAQNISKVLFESRNFVGEKSIDEIQNFVIEQLNVLNGLEVEYFDIVNGESLQNISSWENASSIVGCITVFCGKVRLIDNIRYK